MVRYPKHFVKLVEMLKKLPGVGAKSAERYAFQMLDWSQAQLQQFATIVAQVPSQLGSCSDCGALQDGQFSCLFCTPQRKALGKVCVVAHQRELFAIESTGEFHGVYHVLGAYLSPLDGIEASQLRVEALVQRCQQLDLQEVVLALDATVEGDATALFLKQELECLPVNVSRLAFGLPMGSAFDYVDGGTLARAFSGRRSF